MAQESREASLDYGYAVKAEEAEKDVKEKK